MLEIQLRPQIVDRNGGFTIKSNLKQQTPLSKISANLRRVSFADDRGYKLETIKFVNEKSTDIPKFLMENFVRDFNFQDDLLTKNILRLFQQKHFRKPNLLLAPEKKIKSPVFNIEEKEQETICKINDNTKSTRHSYPPLKVKPTKYFIPTFKMPGCKNESLNEKLKKFEVSLIKTKISRVEDFNYFTGTVVVNNKSFEKQVNIKLTFDNWKSFHLINAKWCNSSHNNKKDIFEFKTNLNYLIKTDEGFGSGSSLDQYETGFQEDCIWNNCKNISFCVQFNTNDSEYWDNNFGSNYNFSVL